VPCACARAGRRAGARAVRSLEVCARHVAAPRRHRAGPPLARTLRREVGPSLRLRAGRLRPRREVLLLPTAARRHLAPAGQEVELLLLLPQLLLQLLLLELLLLQQLLLRRRLREQLLLRGLHLRRPRVAAVRDGGAPDRRGGRGRPAGLGRLQGHDLRHRRGGVRPVKQRGRLRREASGRGHSACEVLLHHRAVRRREAGRPRQGAAGAGGPEVGRRPRDLVDLLAPAVGVVGVLQHRWSTSAAAPWHRCGGSRAN